ncbi:hypothetical protein KF947_21370 [Halomonas sp. FeN2]|uniref:hypothetical protein n=1 Tax=Halomonas sp. FeN2 TaxID=2832500 RepID=UPI001D0B039B|nr:hypothetical protein [Halomonas sp. FeN2]UBR49828.1 hypothetical protein KF947_21370 [Halomonas sp. FeN2]
MDTLIFFKSYEYLAPWLQAIGALIAILIAILVPAYQNTRERRNKEKAELDYLSSILTLSEEVYLLSEYLHTCNAILGDNIVSLRKKQFNSYLSSLESISFQDIPIKKAYIHLDDFRINMGNILYSVNRAWENQHQDDDYIEIIRASVETSAGSLKELGREINSSTLIKNKWKFPTYNKFTETNIININS